MNCTPGNPIIQHINVNENVLDNISKFPSSIRKEIRLLAKQYILLGSNRELDDDVLEHLPLIIDYMDNRGNKFKWEIDGELIKNH